MPRGSYLVAVIEQPDRTYTVGCGGCQTTLATGVSQAKATRIAGSHRCKADRR